MVDIQDSTNQWCTRATTVAHGVDRRQRQPYIDKTVMIVLMRLVYLAPAQILLLLCLMLVNLYTLLDLSNRDVDET